MLCSKGQGAAGIGKAVGKSMGLVAQLSDQAMPLLERPPGAHARDIGCMPVLPHLMPGMGSSSQSISNTSALHMGTGMGVRRWQWAYSAGSGMSAERQVRCPLKRTGRSQAMLQLPDILCMVRLWLAPLLISIATVYRTASLYFALQYICMP